MSTTQDMENALIKTIDGRRRTYPLSQPRVTTLRGAGLLVYGTSDGWCGVRLDGEVRVDEYPAEQVIDAAGAQ